MDAWDLAAALHAVLRERHPAPMEFGRYDKRARRRARRAIRQAEWNMRLGRGGGGVAAKTALVRILLRFPLNRLLARAFTLRWF
jgi:hypothetical protein